LTWIGTPPRSTKMPAVTKAIRAWFMLSSISAVAAPPFVPSRWRGNIDLPASSYAIMRRATGADGAMATITLPVTSNADRGSLHSAATLQLHTVDGNTFNVAIRTS
jgi:hypothetical protein